MLRFFAFGQHTGQFALSGRFEHGTPQPRTDVELAAFFGDEVQRDMDVAVHDLGNDHFGPARHGGMDGVLVGGTTGEYHMMTRSLALAGTERMM